MAKLSITSVVRAETPVRFVHGVDDLASIRTAWHQLETAVGSLRGRHFLGAFDPVEGWYRACVEADVGCGAAERELPECVIAGGRFLRVRLRGEPPELYAQISPAFELLELSAERDLSRPSLELYRRLDRVDALLPVAQ
jgi:hypothetical protein